jgi:ribosome modulation factor
MHSSSSWVDWCLSSDVSDDGEQKAALDQGISVDAVWYSRGVIAGFSGQGVLNCPYTDERRKRYWLRGWASSMKAAPAPLYLVL